MDTKTPRTIEVGGLMNKGRAKVLHAKLSDYITTMKMLKRPDPERIALSRDDHNKLRELAAKQLNEGETLDGITFAGRTLYVTEE